MRMRIAELEASVAMQRGDVAPQLSALMSMSITLLVSHEIEPILALATQSALNLLPGTGAALAFIADDTGEQLTLITANGFKARNNLRFSRQQGFPGHAFLTPRPMLVVGPQLEMLLDDLTEEQHHVLAGLISPYPPSSAIFMPLRTEARRIGAMIVMGGSNAHLLLPRDLPFAQSLGSLVAVALAEVLERERATVLQHALLASKTLHAEAEARLNTAEAQLLQSAKLAAVGELAASIAHEINNPLYAARNSLYLVDQDIPPDSPQRTFLDIAQSELARIAKIVSRMRDFYRPARDELEPVDLNMLIDETMELVQTHLRRGQIIIQSSLSDDVPEIIGHADQIRQVFLNLMINACDAMPDGGTLRVETNLIPSSSDLPPYARIEISDTGQGIPDEHLARIFEPFYTTKAQGTGLGLAISAHIIAQHGGQISVASAVNEGTAFTMLLPVLPPSDAER